LAYTDVYAKILREENTIRSLKSTAKVAVQNRADIEPVRSAEKSWLKVLFADLL
jgi:D-aminopeptidase